MMSGRTFREKLPSALAAIALQAGLVALLALSFETVQKMNDEHETTLILPPLAPPRLPPPMTIDARGRRTPQPLPAPAAPPPPQADLPAPAAPAPPSAQSGVGETPAPQADCVPEGQRRPAWRVACPPPPSVARSDTDDLPLHPESHVKNEEYWAAEKARRDAPVTLPGAEGGPLGILLTALLNPSAFADKRNYGPPLPSTGPAPDPKPGMKHATDAEFAKARQAVNDRKRLLAGTPTPTLAPAEPAVPQ